MDIEEINRLVRELESDRIERKASASEREEIKKAICAFSNDLPNHKKPGYIFVGIDNYGNIANTPITDELLLNLSHIRDEGTILPRPSMNVQKISLEDGEFAAIEVFPAINPPVRFKGVTHVRIGPRKGIATPEEERRLNEKRRSGNLPFDTQPVHSLSLQDLDIDYFNDEYLPNAVDAEILAQNNRGTEDRLKSFRFLSPEGVPTVGGILVTGKDPQFSLPGAYIQFLRVDGLELTDQYLDQKMITGIIGQQLRELDELIKINIRTRTVIPETGREIRKPDYPIQAIQQLIRNAVMHRSYESTNTPVKFYWFSDRIEIHNPGGLYGIVTPENFGRTTDYRNPLLAESMKILGYVQKFGAGIQLARKELQKNGNPEPEFAFESEFTLVTIRSQESQK